MRENWKPDRGGRERLGRALHRAPFAHPATVRGRVCGRIGPLVHWYLCVVAVRACGRARTWPVRSGRARESRGPVRFTRARGASPDSAAAAQGHFCHTLSVRRWPGASPQRGGRLVVRPAAPASRKHPVVIGAGCAARERRWKGPMPSFSALSAWHSRRRGRVAENNVRRSTWDQKYYDASYSLCRKI